MHDTVEFEKRGIPGTVIITQAFKSACVYQFQSKGMAGHPYVELPHPIHQLQPKEMRDVTLRYVHEIVRQLTAAKK